MYFHVAPSFNALECDPIFLVWGWKIDATVLSAQMKNFIWRNSYQDGDMQCSSNFWVCWRNPKVWPFEWNLFGSTFSWYHLSFNRYSPKWNYCIFFLFTFLAIYGIKSGPVRAILFIRYQLASEYNFCFFTVLRLYEILSPSCMWQLCDGVA